MIYKHGWGPDDILPEMFWCLQHGEFGLFPDDDKPYCWRCLSDSDIGVNGENIIKCRVINLAETLRQIGPGQ